MENKPLSPAIWFSIILVAAFTVGYLAWAKSTYDWPYDRTIFPYPEHRRNQNSPFPSLIKEGSGGEFSDWKTYRSDKYGFEVRYPSIMDFKIFEEYGEETFFIFPKSSTTSENRFVIGPTGAIDYGAPSADPILSNIKVGDRTASRYQWKLVKGPELTFVIIEDLPKGWQKGVGHLEILATSQEFKAAADQILPTFRFIEPFRDKDRIVCTQVITPARNPETGEVRNFPTPCDVPEGWAVVE